MRAVSLRLTRVASVVFSAVWLVACGTGLFGPEFDPQAYNMATSLKAETMLVLAKSNEAFSKHKDEVGQLTVKINAAYEYVRGKGNDPLATQEWDTMRSPTGGLYGGYVATWEKKGAISAAARDEALPTISAAFDKIICLESNRRASTPCGGATQ
jgi:hypothetical protein